MRIIQEKKKVSEGTRKIKVTDATGRSALHRLLWSNSSPLNAL